MKLLINPFLWYLLLQFSVLVMLLRNKSGHVRPALTVLLFLVVFMGIASTPVCRTWLEASLEVSPTHGGAATPNIIFVLGGGYFPGAIPDEDVLNSESQKRVLHGVTIWKRHPESRLVFSGGEYAYQDKRNVDRSVQLMAEIARNRGVAETAIVLEPRSHNTREHPLEALKLPGVTSSSRIALVTSGWHMRRAKGEFCRYFTQVQVYPVPPEIHVAAWQDFIPEASYLDANTTLLREWVGMLWYTIIGTGSAGAECQMPG